MIGITSLGYYTPSCFLPAEAISRVWGTDSGKGGRIVANHDEDSVTMAASAVLNCLHNHDPASIDALFFASTTAPYAEKQNASLIASVADLPTEVFAVDYGGSLRAGASAFRLALDAIKSGTNHAVVVSAADCRLAEPGSAVEHQLADGAAAVLVGSGEVAIAVEETFSICEEFTDVWRKHNDLYLRTGDDRFAQSQGYASITQGAVEGLLRKSGCRREDIARVVFYAPNAATHRAVARALGFDHSVYKGDLFAAGFGDAGTASIFLSLFLALLGAQAGERLIWVGYGGGADAFLLRVTKYFERFKFRLNHLLRELASQRVAVAYGNYLKARQVIPYDRSPPFSSVPLLWRDQGYDLRLYGKRCRACRAIQYPVGRICWQCGSKDNFQKVKLSRMGKVFTYTKDYVFPALRSPVVMAVIDLEEGGRFFTELTDCNPEDVRIGLPVELTLRRFHEGGGFYNYYWKAKPGLLEPTEPTVPEG